MLSLIIPVYNEEGAVEDVVRRAHAALSDIDEIIVVDDGSADATPGILKKIDLPRLRVIRHTKNTGNGAAIMTGVEHARGDWIATIDADDTYRPEDIPRLFENLQAENVDMIVGQRRFEYEGWVIRAARHTLCRLASLCTSARVLDINSGLRIVRKELISSFTLLYPDRFSLHSVLTVCALKNGAAVVYEPIAYGPRIGVSKLSCGMKGPWNFCKFLLLILRSSVQSKQVHFHRKENCPELL